MAGAPPAAQADQPAHPGRENPPDAATRCLAARLGELGVGVGVLSAKGYGQEKPRTDKASEQGRAQNRRIEFSVVP